MIPKCAGARYACNREPECQAHCTEVASSETGVSSCCTPLIGPETQNSCPQKIDGVCTSNSARPTNPGAEPPPTGPGTPPPTQPGGPSTGNPLTGYGDQDAAAPDFHPPTGDSTALENYMNQQADRFLEALGGRPTGVIEGSLPAWSELQNSGRVPLGELSNYISSNMSPGGTFNLDSFLGPSSAVYPGDTFYQGAADLLRPAGTFPTGVSPFSLPTYGPTGFNFSSPPPPSGPGPQFGSTIQNLGQSIGQVARTVGQTVANAATAAANYVRSALGGATPPSASPPTTPPASDPTGALTNIAFNGSGNVIGDPFFDAARLSLNDLTIVTQPGSLSDLTAIADGSPGAVIATESPVPPNVQQIGLVVDPATGNVVQTTTPFDVGFHGLTADPGGLLNTISYEGMQGNSYVIVANIEHPGGGPFNFDAGADAGGPNALVVTTQDINNYMNLSAADRGLLIDTILGPEGDMTKNEFQQIAWQGDGDKNDPFTLTRNDGPSTFEEANRGRGYRLESVDGRSVIVTPDGERVSVGTIRGEQILAGIGCTYDSGCYTNAFDAGSNPPPTSEPPPPPTNLAGANPPPPTTESTGFTPPPTSGIPTGPITADEIRTTTETLNAAAARVTAEAEAALAAGDVDRANERIAEVERIRAVQRDFYTMVENQIAADRAYIDRANQGLDEIDRILRPPPPSGVTEIAVSRPPPTTAGDIVTGSAAGSALSRAWAGVQNFFDSQAGVNAWNIGGDSMEWTIPPTTETGVPIENVRTNTSILTQTWTFNDGGASLWGGNLDAATVASNGGIGSSWDGGSLGPAGLTADARLDDFVQNAPPPPGVSQAELQRLEGEAESARAQLEDTESLRAERARAEAARAAAERARAGATTLEDAQNALRRVSTASLTAALENPLLSDAERANIQRQIDIIEANRGTIQRALTIAANSDLLGAVNAGIPVDEAGFRRYVEGLAAAQAAAADRALAVIDGAIARQGPLDELRTYASETDRAYQTALASNLNPLTIASADPPPTSPPPSPPPPSGPGPGSDRTITTPPPTQPPPRSFTGFTGNTGITGNTGNMFTGIGNSWGSGLGMGTPAGSLMGIGNLLQGLGMLAGMGQQQPQAQPRPPMVLQPPPTTQPPPGVPNPLRPAVGAAVRNNSIQPGESTTVSWFASRANSCEVRSGSSVLYTGSGTGSYTTGPLSATTQFGISCTGDQGTGTANVTVYVGVPAPATTASQTTQPAPTITASSGTGGASSSAPSQKWCDPAMPTDAFIACLQSLPGATPPMY